MSILESPPADGSGSHRTTRLDDLYSMREKIDDQIQREVERLEYYTKIQRERANATLNRPGWALCGTDGGYYRHRRTLKEPSCEACKRAHRAAEKDRNNRRLVRQKLELVT